MRDLYNLIAEIISYLLKNTNPDFYRRYKSRTKKKADEEREFLLQKIPALFDRETKGIAEIVKPEDLLPDLKRVYEQCQGENNQGTLLYLVEKLDAALQNQLRREFESRQGEHTEECLNSNWNTYKVGLLPRCGCRWERKHRGSQHRDRIDNFLHNFLLIDYGNWAEWRIEHHFLSASLFARAEGEGKLRVAFSPFKKEDDFLISEYETQEEQRFSIEYTGQADADADYVKKRIDQAAEKKADVLLLPEMLGNTEMENRISEYLQNPGWLNRGSPPALIVLPTVWSGHTNTACLLDGTGGVVCRQEKQYSFSLRESVLEDIRPDRTVHLIHGEGVGRIVILICKDFLTEDYLSRVLADLKATLLLIPSYSTGYHDFEMKLGKLLAEDCCAVWVNACSVVRGSAPEDRRMGMVLRTGKARLKSGEHVRCFGCPEECTARDCTGDCLEVCELYYGREVS